MDPAEQEVVQKFALQRAGGTCGSLVSCTAHSDACEQHKDVGLPTKQPERARSTRLDRQNCGYGRVPAIATSRYKVQWLVTNDPTVLCFGTGYLSVGRQLSGSSHHFFHAVPA